MTPVVVAGAQQTVQSFSVERQDVCVLEKAATNMRYMSLEIGKKPQGVVWLVQLSP